MIVNVKINPNKAVSRLRNISEKVKSKSADAVKQSADYCLRVAKENVPKETKDLMNHIKLDFNNSESVIKVISFTPDKDLQSQIHPNYGEDPGKPLAVLIDNGDVSQLNWGKRTSPKSGRFGYMKFAKTQTEQEFIRLLNLNISEAVK